MLAVVPARAGSKGIPRKNLCRVAGRTLIAHACQCGVGSRTVSHVVISTDDDEMAEEAMRNGADLTVMRPAELADDTATSADTWRHAWREAEDAFDAVFDIAVLLQPTSPLRTAAEVDLTVRTLVSRQAHAAITVSPVPHHYSAYKQLRITKEGTVSSLIPDQVPNQRRQDAPLTHWLNGHCYAIRRDPFINDGVVIPPKTVAIVLERLVVNIDTTEDLVQAERLLARPDATKSPGDVS